jgi:uncharacterized Zn finger protein
MLNGFEATYTMKYMTGASAVKSIEREIDRVTAEVAWWNSWRSEGHIPDYSGIRSGLRALLKQGQADDVVRLGDRMLRQMKRQIEMSNDDGMTEMEMIPALETVFAALKASTLAHIEKMLIAHDWRTIDDYGLCRGLDAFWSQRFPRKTWGEFADILLKRLADEQRDESDWSTRHRRDRLDEHIIEALDKAGRDAEALSLCETEAYATLNFARLVDRLTAAGRLGDAEQWIREGIRVTHEETPGIASGLRTQLRALRAAQSDWPFVAALQAEDFYGSPHIQNWSDMRTSSERAGVWPKVRAYALRFLHTGSSVQPGDRAWPLPATDLPRQRQSAYRPVPNYALLLEIALSEKDLPEVMQLYAACTPSEHPSSLQAHLPDNLLDRVAGAIQTVDPDVAVSIWNGIALRHIALTKPVEYDTAVGYLKQTKKLLLSLKRDREWSEFYAELLEKEKRKRRFLESARAAL